MTDEEKTFIVVVQYPATISKQILMFANTEEEAIALVEVLLQDANYEMSVHTCEECAPGDGGIEAIPLYKKCGHVPYTVTDIFEVA